MNKKKLTPMILVGGILVSLFVILTSYAYWQITRKQQDTNDLVSSCLDFTMEGGARINLEDAWPISDAQGRDLTGYTFTVTNNCKTDVNYVIALESLESDKGLEYLNNNYVKLAIDDEIEKRYGSLDTIDNVVLEGDTEVIRETREVTSATVKGNTQNEHTIRLWISSDAPIDEQNKVFTSRVRITGGQGVENPIP